MTGIRSSFVLLAMLALQAIGSAQATTSPSAPNRRPIVVAVDQTTPQPAGDAAVRRRAEDLATEASDRFSEILSEDKASPSDEVFAPLWSWLSKASSDYRDVIVARLKNPSGEIVVLAPPGSTKLAQVAETPEAPRTEPEPQRALNWTSVVQGIREWLARTNSSYRTEIVKKLVRPAPPGGPAVAEQGASATPPEPQSAPATRGMSPQPGVEAAPQPMAAAAPTASPAPSPAPATGAAPAAAPEARRTGDAAEQAAEDAKAKSRAEEIKRIGDAEDGKRRAAERLATDAKRNAEQRANAEEAEEAEDRAEAKRRAAEAEAERKAEAKRAAAAAAAKRKAEEVKRAADAAEAKRKAVEVKRAAAAAEAADEAKRAADAAEVKRKAAEAKRAGDVAEAKRKAEEKKRLAEEAEAEHKAVEDATRLAQAPTKSAPDAPPAKIPAADVPKHSDAPAQDDSRNADDEARSEPAQSAPVEPKAERRKSAKPHGKKRVQKARRKVTKAHYRGSRKARRKVYRTRRSQYEPARSGEEDARMYVVRRGDTLSAIARRYYGKGSGYRAIYKANRGRIRSPDLIYPRQRLYIPHRRIPHRRRWW